ncbi:hypothetical protein IT571_08210 [Candidatus Sumerlaeota bacterium]|nr:hypothetical protein [Candidatus Sumerlaeota bacterium]
MVIAFRLFKANAKNISSQIHTVEADYHVNVQDLHGTGGSAQLTLMAFVSLCSSALNLAVQDSLALVGNVTIGGVQQKVTNLADVLQVAFDAGAKRVLIPMANAPDIATVPPELFARFQSSFYSGPEDAVKKAVGRL